jgi:hypothetical protein
MSRKAGLMTSGGEHYQAAERLLAKARALPSSEHEQRQALFDEASLHVGLAQVAATMEGHLRASLQREDAWLAALGDGKPTTIQAEAEIDDLEAAG